MMLTWGVCVHYQLSGMSKLDDYEGEGIRGLPDRDSIIGEYASHCDGIFEVRNLRQLEKFADNLA